MTNYFWYNIMESGQQIVPFRFPFVRLLYETYGVTWMWWRSYICGSIESVPDAAVSRCSCQMSAANTDVCGWSSLAFIIFAGFFWSGWSDFVSFCATTGGWRLWSGQAVKGHVWQCKKFFSNTKKIYYCHHCGYNFRAWFFALFGNSGCVMICFMTITILIKNKTSNKCIFYVW